MCQNVNPAKVRKALKWLKRNNPLYEDVEIDFEEFDTMIEDQLIQSDPSEMLPCTHSEQNNISSIDKHQDNRNGEISEPNTSSNQDTPSQEDDVNTMEENNTNEIQNDDITNTSAPLYSFLHSVDFTQYVADKHDTTILSLAPGEGNSPEKVLQMEGKCFPAEFPDGKNTYTEERKPKVSPSRYFNARLFSADNRFARNPEYIFFSQYANEVHQISSNISIALRIGATKTADGRPITASMLTNQDEVRQLIKRDQGYKFLTQVRGTPAFWEKSKKNLFAMIRQLGIPTFFVTFSAADRRWIEIDNAILIQQGKTPMTVEEHKNMSWDQHCRIIMSNPVTASRMFEHRVQTFIRDVIQSPAKPIGEVEDFYYRTEFQQRGWPHIHMVAWVKDAPNINDNSEDEITEFVDKYITCEMPPESDAELREIVTSVQVHTKNHTKSCRKTKKVCRYNFPRPPSNRTFICKSLVQDDDETPETKEAEEAKAKLTLKKIKQLLADKDQDFDEVDELFRAAETTQSAFEESLCAISNKQQIYLKRGITDQWINNYNPHLIRCWNGNMGNDWM